MVSDQRNTKQPIRVGAFVSTGRDIGKLLAMTGAYAEVEFFDAPVSGGRSVVRVPADILRTVILERQTRVWCCDGDQWRIGRILEPPDENTAAYLLAFSGQQNGELTSNEIFVRWSRPLTDPVRLLTARTTDSRFLQRTRSAFVREMLSHRAATDGLVGISSSGIRLHQHQVNAVRRVLLDPVRRYLLADEVGLGKTIEAGMVIRQTLLDTPRSRALVLVPGPLVGQWEDELAQKFDVQGLNKGWADVQPYEWLGRRSDQDRVPISLLVVDEAHRLTDPDTDSAMYDSVATLARTVPSLLLLSATPVRSNEDAFLRLLHLLDPVTYRLEDIDAFRRRIERRDAIGDAVTLLAEDTPAFLLREAIETLRSTFPQDLELSRLLERLDDAIGSDDQGGARLEARHVKHYVSDTYRLHRRLIRTRRNERLQQQFPVRGRTRSQTWRLTDPDPRRKAIVEVLDRFRGRLAVDDSLAPEMLRTVAGRCTAATPAVRSLQRALGSGEDADLQKSEQRVVTALRQSGLGADLSEWLQEALDREGPDGRLDAMANWAWSKVNNCKVAACTSYTSVARAAYEWMQERFGEHRAAALLSDMSTGELDLQYERAQTDVNCVLLVCDTVAEEGWNLQFIREVLHLDVPWFSNRLEQRLGRFDRFSLGDGLPDPVLSTVFADTEPLDTVTGAWTRLLDEGFEIFTKSSATLQYVLREREDAAVARAIDAGFVAIDADVKKERKELVNIRRRIEGQDLLDAVDDSDEDRRFFERLITTDRSSKGLGKAVSNWIGKALNFSESHSGPALRFGISNRNPPLLQESEIRRIGLQHFDRLYVVRRTDCAKRGARLLRPGQPLLDSVLDLCFRDGRGVAFAGMLEVADLGEDNYPMPIFFFDVLIEPEITAGAALVDSERMTLQRQVLKHMPPLVEPIWLVPGLGEPPLNVRAQLENRHTAELNADAGLFRELTSSFDWAATCLAAEAEAKRRVLTRPWISESVTRARRSVDEEESRTVAQFIERSRVFDEEFDASDLTTRYDLIRRAVTTPKVHTDNCGVVIVIRPST